jgi:hypothetical protein
MPKASRTPLRNSRLKWNMEYWKPSAVFGPGHPGRAEVKGSQHAIEKWHRDSKPPRVPEPFELMNYL